MAFGTSWGRASPSIAARRTREKRRDVDRGADVEVLLGLVAPPPPLPSRAQSITIPDSADASASDGVAIKFFLRQRASAYLYYPTPSSTRPPLTRFPNDVIFGGFRGDGSGGGGGVRLGEGVARYAIL